MRSKVDEIVIEIWNRNPFKLPKNLMNGYLGIAWGMGTLVKEKVLSYNKPLKMFFKNAFFMELYINHSFANINLDDNFFSNGLFMEKMRKEGNTMIRYQLDEQMIYLIDDCECILTHKYSYIELNGHLFNSILYYLKVVDNLGLYPVKTKMLLGKIKYLYEMNKDDSLLDRLIYNVLGGDTVFLDMDLLSFDDLDKTEHTHPEKAKNAILTEPPTRFVAGVKNGAYPFKKPKTVQKTVQKRSIAVRSVGGGQKNNQKRSIPTQFDFIKS